MHFNSPPHFPFHKNRYIYSEFLWKVALAEKGPCTDLLSSEPSLGIPSLFFLHEAKRKTTKVEVIRPLKSFSITSLGISQLSTTETKLHKLQNKLSLKAYPAYYHFQVVRQQHKQLLEALDYEINYSLFCNMYTNAHCRMDLS